MPKEERAYESSSALLENSMLELRKENTQKIIKNFQCCVSHFPVPIPLVLAPKLKRNLHGNFDGMQIISNVFYMETNSYFTQLGFEVSTIYTTS